MVSRRQHNRINYIHRMNTIKTQYYNRESIKQHSAYKNRSSQLLRR